MSRTPGPYYMREDHGLLAWVRVDPREGFAGSVFGPKEANHPTIGHPCPACGELFRVGDFSTLVPLGPGADPTEQVKCRAGIPFHAAAIEIHAACRGLVTPERG